MTCEVSSLHVLCVCLLLVLGGAEVIEQQIVGGAGELEQQEDVSGLEVGHRSRMASESVSILEAMVMDHFRHNASKNETKGHSRNESEQFSKKVASMTKEMKNGILETKKREQALMKKELDLFEQCKEVTTKAALAKSMNGSIFANFTTQVKKCREIEKPLKSLADRCSNLVDSESSKVDKDKQLVSTIIKNKADPGTCKVMGGETHLQWLDRMRFHFKQLKDEFSKEAGDLNTDKLLAQTNISECQIRTSNYLEVKEKCDIVEEYLTSRKCDLIHHLEMLCTRYNSCYDGAVKAFELTTKKVKDEERNFKLQWRAMMRVECYIDTFSSASANKAASQEKLDFCNSQKASDTSHLDILYPEIPARIACVESAFPERCLGQKDKKER